MAKLSIPKIQVPKILRRFSNSYIESLVQEGVQAELQKARPLDMVMRFKPTQMPFNRGAVEKPYPMGIRFSTLREFADYYPVARACIEERKSQITKLAWNITPIELNQETAEDKKNVATIKELKKRLKYPTGKKDATFTDWLKQILEDMLVIDAVAVVRRRNRRGDIIGYLPIDGASIQMILEQDGTLPDPPQSAYVQVIQGKEIARLSMDELLYLKMSPSTHSAYGRSPLESLIITITTALKVQAYNLAYLAEGDVPAGFVKVPKDIASSKDQLKEWQDSWDAMLSGDPRFQQKLKFLPEGMDYEPIVKQGDMNFERFEKWLLLNTCFDDQTEVLTNLGWKLFKDLGKGDLVATRSREGELEFQKPTHYQSYLYDGEMVEFKGKMVDLLVTPDHRMLTVYNHGQDRGISGEKFELAKDLVNKDGHLSPLKAGWRGKEPDYFVIPESHYVHGLSNGKKEIVKVDSIKIKTRDWAAFLGLWLAEGWVQGSRGGKVPGTVGKTKSGVRKSTPYKVGISQKKKRYAQEIKSLLERLPFKWRRDRWSFITGSAGLWQYLSVLGNAHQKRIPREILGWSPSLLKVVWEWYIKGDGQFISAGYRGSQSSREVAFSCNPELLGDFQELLLKIGLSGSLRSRPIRNSYIRGKLVVGKQQYLLHKRNSSNVKLNGKTKQYSGMVYDCTVPNGTLYVRRNGKPAWTGNCSVFGVQPEAIGFKFDSNRSSAESAYEAGKERGMFPTALFLKEMMDRILQDDLGHEGLEFSWINLNPTNKAEEAKVAATLIDKGLLAIDEWRIGEGLKPIGLRDPFIMTPVGPIFAKDLAAQSDSGQMPILPYKPPGEATEASSNAGNAGAVPNVPNQANVKVSTNGENIRIEELRRWKRAAANDLKQGKIYRDFKTDIIDLRTQDIIRKGLRGASTREDLELVFSPFLSANNEVISPLLDLYANINETLQSEGINSSKSATVVSV